MVDNYEVFYPFESEGDLEVSHACVVIDGDYIEVPFTQTEEGITLHLDLIEVEGHG